MPLKETSSQTCGFPKALFRRKVMHVGYSRDVAIIQQFEQEGPRTGSNRDDMAIALGQRRIYINSNMTIG
jgi:hypothetical protein